MLSADRGRLRSRRLSSPCAYGDRREYRRGCAAGRGSAGRARLGVCNDGALVVQHLPRPGRVLPERRPAGDAFSLPKGVRQQVHINTDPAAVEIAGLPLIRGCALVPLLQDVEDVFAAVRTPRGTHLPTIIG